MKDDVEYSPRSEAVRRVERMKYYITRRHEWTNTVLEQANPIMQEMSAVFECLDKHFIAPHATDPGVAEDAYYLLDRLMFLSWYAGCCLDETPLKRKELRALQSARGKLNGEKLRAIRERRFAHAEELAQQIRKENPCLRPPKVAEEIWGRWKLKDPSCPGYETLLSYVRTMISSGSLVQSLQKKKGRTMVRPAE